MAQSMAQKFGGRFGAFGIVGAMPSPEYTSPGSAALTLLVPQGMIWTGAAWVPTEVAGGGGKLTVTVASANFKKLVVADINKTTGVVTKYDGTEVWDGSGSNNYGFRETAVTNSVNPGPGATYPYYYRVGTKNNTGQTISIKEFALDVWQNGGVGNYEVCDVRAWTDCTSAPDWTTASPTLDLADVNTFNGGGTSILCTLSSGTLQVQTGKWVYFIVKQKSHVGGGSVNGFLRGNTWATSGGWTAVQSMFTSTNGTSWSETGSTGQTGYITTFAGTVDPAVPTLAGTDARLMIVGDTTDPVQSTTTGLASEGGTGSSTTAICYVQTATFKNNWSA
ncbi:MAG: hypothetical protein WC551_12765 [Patescibacteria group bacterium]